MDTTCQCGMALERASAGAGCSECGTACCRRCGIEMEARTYCRWCAMSLTQSAA
jgi:hypothetical protein